MKDATQAAGLVSQVDTVNSKKRVLREELARRIKTPSADWLSQAIVVGLCEVHGVTLDQLTGLQYKKRKEINAEYEGVIFKKGSPTDLATKAVAVHYFRYEDVLRSYADAIQRFVEASNGQVRLRLLGDFVSVATNDEDEPSLVYEFAFCVPAKSVNEEWDAVYRTADGVNTDALAMTANGITDVHANSPAMAILRAIARKYDLQVFVTQPFVEQNGDEGEVACTDIILAE